MSKTYFLRPEYRLIRKSDHVYIIGEKDHFVITEKLPADILSLVDGTRSDEEIAAVAGKEIAPAMVFHWLGKLEKKGYISEAGEKDRPEGGFVGKPLWMHDGSLREKVQAYRYIIRKTSVDGVYEEQLRSVLLQNGLVDKCGKAGRTVEIILCSDYLEPELHTLVRKAGASGNRCFPVKIAGRRTWFGPLTDSGQKHCWGCLAYQVRKNRPVEQFLSATGNTCDGSLQAACIYPAVATTAIHCVVSTIVQQLCLETAGSLPYITVFDSWNMEIERHPVRKRPQCDACGDATLFGKQVERPVTFQKSKRNCFEDGGYRIVAPEETWNRYRHLVSPLTGIIGRIEPYQGKDHRVRPVWRATYFINPAPGNVTVKETFVRESCGKGHTPSQARVSALCEAVERYSAQYHGDEPVLRGSYSSLKKSGAVDPRALMNFSNSQYVARTETENDNRIIGVPLPFDEHREISWTPAWSMTKKKRRLLPLSYCYTYAPQPENEFICSYNPNGHAAGNSVEEALLQGVLELVERDCVAIWWYNRILRRGMDLTSFDDPYFIEVEKHYAEMGWKIWVLDITHDLAIPSAVAVARNDRCGTFITGFGCHLAMHLAVRRAITEIHQVYDPSGVQKPVCTGSDVGDPAFLFPDTSMPPISADDYPSPPLRTIDEDAAYCIKALEEAGMEVMAIDYTRPDIGLPCVKVIVPGLRHFWKRLGEGRLYDVPVKMGWLRAPLHENELNPHALML